eukprot:scaffold26718_cov52-Phaeocystis_antarctica.AAC.1
MGKRDAMDELLSCCGRVIPSSRPSCDCTYAALSTSVSVCRLGTAVEAADVAAAIIAVSGGCGCVSGGSDNSGGSDGGCGGSGGSGGFSVVPTLGSSCGCCPAAALNEGTENLSCKVLSGATAWFLWLA